MVDLIHRLNQKGLNEKGAILNELDELYNDGLVKHGKVQRPTDGEYIYYIGGELKPGIRTPEIVKSTVIPNK